MNVKKGRLLTLLMAIVMICALAPMALMAGTGTDGRLSKTSLTLSVGEKSTLSVNMQHESYVTNSSTTWTTNDPSIATVSNGTVTAKAVGSATITANVSVTYASNSPYEQSKTITWSTTCAVTVTGASGLTSADGANSPSYTIYSYGGTKDLAVRYNGGAVSASEVEWYIENATATSGTYNNYISLYAYNDGSARVTANNPTPSGNPSVVVARYTPTGATLRFYIYVSYSSSISVSATVYDTNPGYALDDTPDEGSTSIASQIRQRVNSLVGSGSYYDYDVTFGSNYSTQKGSLNVSTRYGYSSSELDDVVFTPATLSSSTTSDSVSFSFDVRVYYTKNGSYKDYSGTMTFTIKKGTVTSGNVVFYGDVGDTVYMDTNAFEDYWDEKFPGGTLEYVTFNGVSGGTLYDEESKTITGSSKKFYASPARGELDLDDVYFVPSSANSKKAVTISFKFDAHGRDKSKTSKDITGTVNIVYMSDSPSVINYNVGANGTVSLRASDFTAAYKEATGDSAPSSMNIVFQTSPRNGSLSYQNSSKSSSKAESLTSSKIRNYTFTTKSSGNYQIGDVTYTGNSSYKDEIEYIAYSGTTPKFKGTVTFNGSGSTDVVVTFQSVSGNAAQFAWSEFTKASSALSSASKIHFTVNTNGTLYLNGTTNAGGIDLTPSQVNSVTFRPNTGFNGQSRIYFMAYDSSSRLVASGTVVVNVAGNPSTPVNTTTPTASPFGDVKATDWYYANLMTLYSKGIMQGKGDGRFYPNESVRYGEALKMVMSTCGYTYSNATTGHWASLYRDAAVAQGWIDSSVNLDSPISRNAVAELVCKVLGITPTGKASPYADAANNYGIELYYTNPQIFTGSANPKGGKPLFANNEDLTRGQVCMVIVRLESYQASHSGYGYGSTTVPDGT